ncbi:polysaccharide biosynthesis/export family protein [Sphingopyxis sp.]|uniref:polysaccharide biosynthesis/export family protein n=1 Tax=Sphingopyxis sp. TaxID=1908224 RepID=UPI002D79E5CA|nr:polysaccharide biosynthesis/export family protein [Sphingopyxis sp.]HET6526076.1 polysaccharide biosynthesis/export family protein [Sphingopyxis sp.]
MIKAPLTVAIAVAATMSSPAQAQQAEPPVDGGPRPVASGKPLAGTADSTYRINAGDELEVYVWGEERLQRKVKVLPDGTIAFPLVGQIKVQGYLPSEVEALITNGLSAQYVGAVPQVTVSVVVPSGMQFSVMGRVKSPGTFTPGRYVNVLEALSMAGGPAEFANLDNVLIIRKSGAQISALSVRLAPLFKLGSDAKDVAGGNILQIETGDTVIVR